MISRARPTLDPPGKPASPGKKLRFTVAIFLSFASIEILARAAPLAPSVAFFYAGDPPLEELAHFERVVLEPANAEAEEIASLHAAGVEVLAYLSLGEVRPDQPWRTRVPAAAILGRNEAWGSLVVDQTSSDWRKLVVEELAAELLARGFDGLFLDTLDSYALVAKEEPARSRQIEGLAETILALANRHPSAVLVLNRGFEVLPRVAGRVRGLVAESLFRGYDPRRGYFEVAEENREWLVDRLREARDEHALEVSVIDYLPARERVEARRTAQRIAALGFTPWVATPELDVLGVGAREVIPRRVLAVFDGDELPLEESVAHRLAGTVLEHLGLFVEYHDVRSPLPVRRLAGRYAGVVAWIDGEGDDARSREAYRDWLLRQREDGVPIVLLGSLGLAPTDGFLAALGLAPVGERPRAPLELEALEPAFLDFEAPARVPPLAIAPPLRSVSEENRVLARLRDAQGVVFDPLVIAPWGGLALRPAILRTRHDMSNDWILDPFAFFREALRLEPAPQADTTTENGSRLLITHIDGDGAASRAEWRGTPLAVRVVLDDVLREYRIPTTVSFIEGEVSSGGVYPQTSAEVETIAREIFALPWVETATHAYSHPFTWAEAEREPESSEHRLAIPDYTLDLEREIVGSAEYLSSLAPATKPVRVMLWTGDALPSERALRITREAGFLQLNGGMTCATNDHPSITRVTPILRPVGEELQVYAPIMNENVYTGLWTGPFWGFRRVVETFAITGSPRRLKPLNIYYHFYSGSKRASLRALRTVYDAALAERPLSIFASEYARIATDFARITISRSLEGEWRFRGSRDLRTFRCPAELGWPDLDRSSSWCALREIPQGRYLSFAAEGEWRLFFRESAPTRPHVSAANARIARSAASESGQRVELEAREPGAWLEITAAAPPRVLAGGETLSSERIEDRRFRVEIEGGGPRDVVVLPAE